MGLGRSKTCSSPPGLVCAAALLDKPCLLVCLTSRLESTAAEYSFKSTLSFGFPEACSSRTSFSPIARSALLANSAALLSSNAARFDY